ncbi:GNAT family N-acetyltransferase [Aquimarina celericrescens]|nr:GNAT family N-acetyltransferase [Aquimarina celericrescens]
MIKILNTESLTVDKEIAIQNLFKQLSPNKKQIPLNELLSNQYNPLIFIYHKSDEKITGIASMCLYKVISGHKGWIEDVVVDFNHRGEGIGKKLIQKLINLAKEKNLSEINLFTEDEKKAAISLYSKLGFKQSSSRLYNLKITKGI